ncbi:MAG: DNA-processing protein DprA [Patescibacteria group bacterium]|nr:DNA-processing protein DprA [Patescibacteria group bacterium]
MEKYIHAFNLLENLGPVKIKRVIDSYPNAKSAWEAQNSQINADEEWKKIPQDIKVISYNHHLYPEKLKEIYAPPVLLYCRGNMDLLNRLSVAVVGSRKISEYGIQSTKLICRPLARAGVVIVSGLALGVDGLSHETALELNGPTIAVLGSGINDFVIYPYQNRSLAQKIINNNGLVLSEYPPQEKAAIHYFPARNRIISGLSSATIIIEAQKRSGALITAFKALEQNRDVFAVPGSIFSPNSQGTNYLIKKGAQPLISGQDIIDELQLDLNVDNSSNNSCRNYSLDEQSILKNITEEAIHIDKIIKITRLKPAVVIPILTQLEIEEVIFNLGNNRYVINNTQNIKK